MKRSSFRMPAAGVVLAALGACAEASPTDPAAARPSLNVPPSALLNVTPSPTRAAGNRQDPPDRNGNRLVCARMTSGPNPGFAFVDDRSEDGAPSCPEGFTLTPF